MFYACFSLIGSWEGKKNFRVGNILNKNLLGLGYRKQTTVFRSYQQQEQQLQEAPLLSSG